MGWLLSVFRERLFLYLLPITIFMSALTCIGWGAPLNYKTLVILPVAVSYISAMLTRAFSGAWGRIYMGIDREVSPEEAERDFDLALSRDKAKNSEKSRLYAEAVTHYRAILAHTPGDLLTRERVAWICETKLGDTESAISEYRVIEQQAPPDTLLRQNAIEALKRLIKARREREDDPATR